MPSSKDPPNLPAWENAVLGRTQAELAADRGVHPRVVRDEYRAVMRAGDGVDLPAVTRVERDDGVVKFCLPLAAGPGAPQYETESVIIPMSNYHGDTWRTLCVSSQVGCRMGCTFCETATMGLRRNLTAAEIVRQFFVARTLIDDEPIEAPEQYCYYASGFRNVVFMGMGEPLDNFDEVVQAIRVLTEPNGVAFPQAQITVSTVGKIDGLRKLAALGWPNLRVAISLNAPNDDLRSEIMPVNNAMPLADLKRALLEYPIAAKGLFLIEYVLLGGVNDSDAHARELAAWCRDLRCVVNLIPYNPQRDAAFEPPSEDAVIRFSKTVRAEGVFVKRRLTHGRELMGACGQLGNPAFRKRA